jgi:hypothetical protein
MYGPLTVGSSPCLCSSVIYRSVYVDLIFIIIIIIVISSEKHLQHVMFTEVPVHATHCTVGFSTVRDNMKEGKTCEENRWGNVELHARRQYRQAQNECLYGPFLTTLFSGTLKQF